MKRLFRCASVARRDRAGRLADRGLSNRALANRHFADRRLLGRIDRHGLSARQIRSVCSRHQSKRSTQSNYNLLHSHTPEGLVQTRQRRAPRHGSQKGGRMRPSCGTPGTCWRHMLGARRCDVSGYFREIWCPHERSGGESVIPACRFAHLHSPASIARPLRLEPFRIAASMTSERDSGYGFPRKFDRIFSANHTTKIAANERAKYRAVHKSALPAFVMASSLASEIKFLAGKDSGGRDGRFARDQYCCGAERNSAASSFRADCVSEPIRERCPPREDRSGSEASGPGSQGRCVTPRLPAVSSWQLRQRPRRCRAC